MDTQTLLSHINHSPVIPVIVIDDAEVAVDLAHALVAGGIHVLEITLRTQTALTIIHRLRDKVPQATVGAGTVRTGTQLNAARDAGAQFIMTPGLTPKLTAAAHQISIPFIPGIATPTEAMSAAEEGFLVQKLFPAAIIGGERLLDAMAGPLPELRFCPTGGINTTNAKKYLALPNVLAVGGSWLTPSDAIKTRDWNQITTLARDANQLR